MIITFVNTKSWCFLQLDIEMCIYYSVALLIEWCANQSINQSINH